MVLQRCFTNLGTTVGTAAMVLVKIRIAQTSFILSSSELLGMSETIQNTRTQCQLLEAVQDPALLSRNVHLGDREGQMAVAAPMTIVQMAGFMVVQPQMIVSVLMDGPVVA